MNTYHKLMPNVFLLKTLVRVNKVWSRSGIIYYDMTLNNKKTFLGFK